MAETPAPSPAVRALRAHRAALEELWRLANRLKWRFGNPGTARLVADFDRAMEEVRATRAAYDEAVRGTSEPHDDEEPPDDGRGDMSDVPMDHELADDERHPWLTTADWRE